METWDRRKTGVLVVLLALAAVAALYWAALQQQPRGTEAQQIRSIFIRGERAIEERKLPDVMALVSRDYRDDEGLRYGSLRVLAGRQMRDAQSIDIGIPDQLLHIEVEPDGKHARAQARVDIHVVSRLGTTEDLSSNLSIHFVKEPVRYYWLFPGEEWRLEKAEGWQGMAGE